MEKRNRSYNVKIIDQQNALVIPGARPIAGRRQYVVTEDGEVYRIFGSMKNPGKPLVKSKATVKSGKSYYLCVTLLTVDSITHAGEIADSPEFKRLYVHRLVCAAFHGPAPAGKPWVNHKDGDKTNNHYSNLEWTSISENVQHAFDTGLRVHPSGEKHWNYGKTVGATTKALMSSRKTGENHPKFKGWWEIDGVRYSSGTAAAKALKVPFHKMKKMATFITKP